MTGWDQVITATSTVQLPLYRAGREGEVDWTKQRCVFTIELCRDCFLVQKSDTIFSKNFSEFSDGSSNFSKNLSKTSLFNFWTGAAWYFHFLTFQRLFNVQLRLPLQELERGGEGEDDRTRAAWLDSSPLNFSRLFRVQVPSDGVWGMGYGVGTWGVRRSLDTWEEPAVKLQLLTATAWLEMRVMAGWFWNFWSWCSYDHAKHLAMAAAVIGSWQNYLK